MNIETKIQADHPLAPYGTFQIGGPADFFLKAESREDLLAGLKWAAEKKLPFFVFGGGSNLLFDDAGFRGLVIQVKMVGLHVEGERLVAEAGVKSSVLVKAAADAGLTGLEAWNGLPGTVGGAVYGNAGCFGVETADILEWTEVWDGHSVKRMTARELDYQYRNSHLKQEAAAGRQHVVLRACFRLPRGEAEDIKKTMMEVARLRLQKQPAGRNNGSFFKNPHPPEDHPQHGKSAGWLIDQCGLKGESVGGATISEQHGNFFMNTGGATAKDVMTLAGKAQEAVRERFGLDLEREIVYVPA